MVHKCMDTRGECKCFRSHQRLNRVEIQEGSQPYRGHGEVGEVLPTKQSVSQAGGQPSA